jgi:transposase
MLTIIIVRMVVNTMRKIDEILEQDNQNPEIQAIKAAMKQTKDKRMYQRYRVIYLHLRGYTNRDIAKEEGFCEHTVGTYISKYNKEGLDGLRPKPNPGAPRLLTPEQEKELALIITTKTPDEVGFPNRKNWYINIVQEWVKNTWGVKYSHRGMAEVLYRMELSFTRPTYTLTKADPKKQEQFKQDFELLKKPS